jgi:hypothetical protein
MLFEITNPNSGEQTLLLDKLRSSGCEVIQTSSGLVVSAVQMHASAFAKDFGIDEACVAALTKDRLEQSTPDVQAFASGKR